MNYGKFTKSPPERNGGRVFNAGLRPAPHGALRAPSGGRLGAFPRTPCRLRQESKPVCRHNLLFRAAYVRQSPQTCGDCLTRGLNARVHSAVFLTGKKPASLAPCALGGDRLARSVCEQTVVMGKFSAPRIDVVGFIAGADASHRPRITAVYGCLRIGCWASGADMHLAVK